MDVFLLTMMGTKIICFMRGIISEKKSHLKQNDVNRLDLPAYQEISLKNLYDDAMKDPVLSKYLPTREQLSNKLPKNDFFFGVVFFL